MSNWVNNIKKTALFLTGVLMVVWGYRANVDNIENENKNQDGPMSIERQQPDGTARTIMETDEAEESSGSQCLSCSINEVAL